MFYIQYVYLILPENRYQSILMMDRFMNIWCHLSVFTLTLSGAHFPAAPTPEMKVSIRVFGVADYESEVRFSK